MDDGTPTHYPNLRPFPKGKSGNPGGRSKAEFEIRRAAKALAAEALETLVLVMRNGKPHEAALAANSILDRAFGKPQQHIAADGAGLVVQIVKFADLPIDTVEHAPLAQLPAAGSAD